MAIVWRGMTAAERVALTGAMTRSGDVLDWSDAGLSGPVLDKHAGNELPTTALLTDMNQVLGRSAGNAVEVRESIDHLTGAAHDARLVEVTLALSAEVLVLGKLQPDLETARSAAARALDSGAAAERFAAMVLELGGPPDLIDAPSRHLPDAPVVRAIEPESAGVVTAVDVRAVAAVRTAYSVGGAPSTTPDPVIEVQRIV